MTYNTSSSLPKSCADSEAKSCVIRSVACPEEPGGFICAGKFLGERGRQIAMPGLLEVRPWG